VKDFWTIADRQGWSDETASEIMIAFISSRGLTEELAEHAEKIADNENEEWRAL
jgi:hypothetical protein